MQVQILPHPPFQFNQIIIMKSYMFHHQVYPASISIDAESEENARSFVAFHLLCPEDWVLVGVDEALTDEAA